MPLKNEAIEQFNTYLDRQAALNQTSVDTIKGGHHFTVHPQVEYIWTEELANDDGLLAKIDIAMCEDQIINDLGLADPGLVSGRTDTETKDRQTTALGGFSGIEYKCVPTQHDTHITFKELNAWARAKDKFQIRIRNKRLQSKRNDLKMIGWNGKTAATETNKTTSPLGEDVNIGWLQRMRDHKPEHVMTTIKGSPIVIGPSGEIKTLDALVVQALSLIPPQYRKDLELFVSSDLLVDHQMQLIEKSTPTELGKSNITHEAAYIINGLIATTPDFYPDGTVMLTAPDNLAIRIQEGSIRAGYEANHKCSRYENYNESNDVYGIHNYDAAVLAEGITLEGDTP